MSEKLHLASESILDAFTYGDYPEGCDGKPRIGDYVYVFRQIPPNLEEQGFDARIVLYSDDSRDIKSVPSIIFDEEIGDQESGKYGSIFDCLLCGYEFTQITKEQYELGLADIIGKESK
jgi:hypothetical protein